jgi:hypothetical protein
MKNLSVVLIILAFGLLSSAFAECPLPCPADINGDCIVDLKDLSILSANWLKECVIPESLPILMIKNAGVSDEQARKIAEGLGINPEAIILADGVAHFIEPAAFQKVPTMPFADQQLIAELTKESERDGDVPLTFEAFDFGAMRKIVPFPETRATAMFSEALQSTDLLPAQFATAVDHTTFEAVNLQDQLLLPAVQLDTRVNFEESLDGYPILGPGSQLSVSFDSQGVPTQMLLARRGFDRGDSVPLIQPQEALGEIQRLNGGFFVPTGPLNLVYYAPPLSQGNVQFLIPHFDVGGILYGPEGQQSNKLRILVPAVADTKYAPAIDLSVSAVRQFVTAEVAATGGTPPYQYEWFSSSVDLSQFTESKIQYAANPGDTKEDDSETVTVHVTDDNGVLVAASETILLSYNPPDIGIFIAGVSDFGVERAVSDLCAANQAGFVNRFLAEGVQKRFNWSGTSAWERDFKEGPTGLDNSYVDNCDLTFYCGHGYGGGFTFESNQDDGYLTYTDAAGAWGDNDLEFLCLLSCQVLKETYDGKSWAQRWGPAFQGLHLLCGFQTNAYDWPNFGPRFADYTLGRNFFFTTVTLPVRAAWFQAKKEEQPSSVEAVVMGVIGPGGCISGYNDYFWGQGPVGPDIRGSYIHGYWRVVYK